MMLKTGQLCYLHLKSFREEDLSRIFFGSPKPIPAASSCLLKSLAIFNSMEWVPGLLGQEKAEERSNKPKTQHPSCPLKPKPLN
jgi:hypothetical protein